VLQQITPLILTYNEAPNIGRTLEQLRWAKDIVVVDSFSDDGTLEISAEFPQARVFQRKFDRHDQQWNFGLTKTSIATDWVMALDADFVLTAALIEEIKLQQPSAEICGYRAPFTFCINGRNVRSAICPPATFLYRRGHAGYFLDGHTQKLKVNGHIETLTPSILHDDRKSLPRWFDSQKRYAQLEAHKLINASASSLDFADRVRRLRVVAPLAMGFYCLVIRGGILDGRAVLFYACQRVAVELMLSLFLLEHDLGRDKQKLADSQLVETELIDVEHGS